MIKTHNTAIHIALIIILMIMDSCGSKENSKETLRQEKIAYLNQAIHDSIKSMNIPFVKNAIRQGKDIAKDSDEYYSFVMNDIILYFYTAQPDSMLACTEQSINYLSDKPFTPLRNKMMIKCLQAKGSYYSQYASNLDSLLYYHSKSCEFAEKDPLIEERLLCYSNLADAYKQKGELAKSAATYRKAIFIADSTQTDKENYIPLYLGIAATYTALHDFEQSKIWWDRSYELWRYMMPHEQFNYLNNRGNDYYYQKDYQHTLDIFLRLDTFLQARPELEWERYFCHANLSDAYLKLQQPEKAKPLIEKNISFFNSIQMNEVVMSYLYTQQMDLAMQEGNFNLAEELIKRNPLPSGLQPDQTLIRLDFLQKYYESKPDWNKAFYYQKAYKTLDDSLRNERIKMRVTELQMRYERDTTILGQRIYIGEKENELTHTYILLIVCIFLVSLLLLLIYYRRKQAKIKEEQMLHRIVELRMENIRNRITPHFIYNALNHELLARQQGKPTQLNTLVNLLRQGQALANVFCTSLKEELDFINLYVDIEGEALGGNFNYKVIISNDIDPQNVQLPSMMIQIFVENAIKHGLKDMPQQKEKILILNVFRAKNCICIEVRNNGKPLKLHSHENKTQTGLRVVSQTIQLLNERNRQPMSYNLSQYEENGETGCIAQLIIPNNYTFNIN